MTPHSSAKSRYNAAVIANTFVRNGLVKGPQSRGFPTAAIYISESGSDPRVGTAYGRTFDMARNLFIDNWSGVIAWEKADRFAASPANTSSGYTTLVNPSATLSACASAALIRRDPFISDCRWKTQNVKVHDNVFTLTPSHLGPACSPANMCGYSAVFANYGSFPDWSPYKGTAVERRITFAQNNRWLDNTYLGPWRFIVLEQGNDVSWDTWRGSTYAQDLGSTLRRTG